MPIHRAAPPARSVSLHHGTVARVGPGGRVQSIHTNKGVTIQHGFHGQRTIITEHGGRRMVSMGARHGYMERPYLNRGGRVYVQRTYLVGNHREVSVYRTHRYRGADYYAYVPPSYYRPVFYGWAYDSWRAPVYYNWGWSRDPWFGAYGYYFAPARVYTGAPMWLTDFLLAASLSTEYQDQADSPVPQPAAQGAPTLTPEIKQAIADEVRYQLNAERTASANTLVSAPAGDDALPALDPAMRVFVVSHMLDVMGGDQSCSLTAGDIITRLDDAPDADQNLSVLVTSSKRSDCPMGERVVVSLSDLQEMHNRFRQQIDSGLQTLAQNQGRNGLPAAPDTRMWHGEVPPPSPDDVQVEMRNQQMEADRTEAEVQSQVGPED